MVDDYNHCSVPVDNEPRQFDSQQDEENSAMEASKAFNSSILAAQMDPRMLTKIQLPPSTKVHPYQMTLGRNPVARSILFQNLRNQNNGHHFGDSEVNCHKNNNNYQRFQGLSLNDQLEEFVSSQLLSVEQARRRWQLATDLFFILREYYPSCQLYVFGSLLSGLGDPYSDIDIYMDFKGDDSKSLGERPSAKGIMIYSLQDCVQEILTKTECPHSSSKIFAAEVELIGTRVPIVRFRHVQTGINCDISFGNRISVQNTKLFKFYQDFDPRVKPLILFLRYWATFHGICGSQKIKKYALALMAVVYFTKKNILPSINLLQTLAAAERSKQSVEMNPDKLDGWDASFCSDPEMIRQVFQTTPLAPEDYQENKGRLFLATVLEFFEMMVTTDISSVVICPLMGKMISREILIDPELAEEPLPIRLRNWRMSYESPKDFCKETRIFKPLVIMDPFVMEFNVAGLVTEVTLERFTDACKSTVKILKNGPKSILDLFQPLI